MKCDWWSCFVTPVGGFTDRIDVFCWDLRPHDAVLHRHRNEFRPEALWSRRVVTKHLRVSPAEGPEEWETSQFACKGTGSRRMTPDLLSTSFCLMDCGGLDRGSCRRWIIHPLIFIDCVYVSLPWFLLVTWHLLFCPSWRGILLCCSPEGFFTLFPFFEFFFLFLGSFSWSDVRSKVRDVVCVQNIKPTEDNLW